MTKKDTSLLVRYKGAADPLFGIGHYHFQVSPSSKFLIFAAYPDFINLFGKKPRIIKIDLETKKVTTLLVGYNYDPKISADNKFILYKGDGGIFVIEISTLQSKFIGKANFAQWLGD